MRINSNIVGARLKEYTTVATWRHTTNYAASVCDMNPRYYDDLREGGIVAPPMFAVAVSWPVQQNISQYMEMPYPPDLFRTMVHYAEYIEFFRLIRPGDRLSVKGEVAAVIPHRSGTQMVFRFPVTDPEGRPFHTEFVSALLRGVACGDGGREAISVPAPPKQPPAAAAVWEDDIYIGKEAPYVYDGGANIVFAIHTSPAFARSAGLPGIILQGTATMAYAVRQLINREAEEDPAKLKVISGRFTGMVMPDSRIKVRLLERETNGGEAHLYFDVINGQGQRAISKGYIRLSV